ncbi:hypothetical protein HYQ46_002102 [Verticillium longisporum]|nr:hypothetical protein HYQ46_002102 [Verticillium longisporum]
MIRSVLSLELNNETLNHRPSGQGLPARPGVNPSVTHHTHFGRVIQIIVRLIVFGLGLAVKGPRLTVSFQAYTVSSRVQTRGHAAASGLQKVSRWLCPMQAPPRQMRREEALHRVREAWHRVQPCPGTTVGCNITRRAATCITTRGHGALSDAPTGPVRLWSAANTPHVVVHAPLNARP